MRTIRHLDRAYQVVVVGGGLSGVCAAIASARHGAKTALIQARSVLGGNASSEIRMHIMGAGCHDGKENLNESGILLEMLLENKCRNPYHSFSIWDTVVWEKTRYQPGLDLYLNTCMQSCTARDGVIEKIECYQSTTETSCTFSGEVFIDATGHGTLGVLCGAASRIGSEGRAEFDEPNAPEHPNSDTMGNTILFQAVDRGEPVKFIKPDWAYDFSEDDLKYRTHIDHIGALGEMGVVTAFKEGRMKELPDFYNLDSGYWWIELGGQYDDIIAQGEEIRDELLRCVYGVWNHIKNVGDHGADNYDLAWVGFVPGYRESRRLEGDYLLNERDVRENRVFPDAVAYGAWPMDEHVRGGILDFDKRPSRLFNFDGCYTIPYRCFYSKNVDNLMMAGRDISTTKMAFGSTRVMGTCAVGGQAAGTAAAMAVRYGIRPREVGSHIDELQQALLKDDCFIPGFRNHDPADLAREARVSSSGEVQGREASGVLSGVARPVEECFNGWESGPLGAGAQTISLELPQKARLRQIRLTFDPNLTRSIMPSITRVAQQRQHKGVPVELVRDYDLALYLNGECVKRIQVRDNCQRLNVLDVDQMADKAEVTVLATNGLPAARIHEIRLY